LKKNGRLLFLVFLSIMALAATVPVFSQAEPAEAGETSDIQYYIRSINFNIVGRTRVFALREILDLREGQRIGDRASVETLVRRKTQILRNQRVLEDSSCRIDYTTGEAEDGGEAPVDFLVQTKDAWNFFAFPEPKFDSNTGFSITLKARDWNFLGTMSPLEIDLGYEIDEEQQSAFVDVDADIPFRFLGYTWMFNFDNEFTYNEIDPNYYKNVTGLTMNIPFRQTTFTVGFDQSFLLNEENSDEEKLVTQKNFFEDKWYMSSELYARWEIPLGIEVGDFGTLTYFPQLTETFKYRPGGDVGEYRRGPTTRFEHSFGFGQINWIGNFRNGLSASISNVNTFNNFAMRWDINAGITAEGHFALTEFFGISSRLKYRIYFDSNDYDVGAALRGIRDKDFIADNELMLNLELPLRFLKFTPSQWFNSRYFRPFDVEFHFSPFVDIAFINGKSNRNYRDEKNYSFGNPLIAVGFEIIAFSLPWRNLNLRASLGWDVQEWIRTGNLPGGRYQELYIGLHHFY
jgi:hypothetical protein